MAMPAANSSPRHSAQVVGNTFMEQYYRVLLGSPENAHKFYVESSVFGRPGPDGNMMSVTTEQGIMDKIASLDYKGCRAEIKTVDAQDSCNGGVIVLVTGWLVWENNVRRSFTQTFFLAPHAKGYYVLNDVFRFMDVLEAVTPSAVSDADENVASTPLTPNEESTNAPSHLAQSPRSPVKVTSNGSEASDSSDKKGSIESNGVVVKEVVSEEPLSSSQNDGDTVAAKSGSKHQEDTPKISYASIVVKERTVASQVAIPTVVVKASSTHYLDQSSAAPKESAVRSNSAPQKSKPQTEEGKSIYIGNLPSNVTDQQLEGVLKKFGPIKKKGIQIRSYQDGFCYGFVEFESSSSARSAIEAHNVMVGSYEAYITEKKSTNQAGNGRGRIPAGKGEFRNDNYRNRENFARGDSRSDNYRNREDFSKGDSRSDSYRNRENFAEGRSHGRYQNGNRGGEFSVQTRSPRGRSGEGRERVYQNGGGRTPRSSGSR